MRFQSGRRTRRRRPGFRQKFTSCHGEREFAAAGTTSNHPLVILAATVTLGVALAGPLWRVRVLRPTRGAAPAPRDGGRHCGDDCAVARFKSLRGWLNACADVRGPGNARGRVRSAHVRAGVNGSLGTPPAVRGNAHGARRACAGARAPPPRGDGDAHVAPSGGAIVRPP